MSICWLDTSFLECICHYHVKKEPAAWEVNSRNKFILLFFMFQITSIDSTQCPETLVCWLFLSSKGSLLTLCVITVSHLIWYVSGIFWVPPRAADKSMTTYEVEVNHFYYVYIIRWYLLRLWYNYKKILNLAFQSQNLQQTSKCSKLIDWSTYCNFERFTSGLYSNQWNLWLKVYQMPNVSLLDMK